MEWGSLSPAIAFEARILRLVVLELLFLGKETFPLALPGSSVGKGVTCWET